MEIIDKLSKSAITQNINHNQQCKLFKVELFSLKSYAKVINKFGKTFPWIYFCGGKNETISRILKQKRKIYENNPCENLFLKN